jgi:hypothetical protein
MIKGIKVMLLPNNKQNTLMFKSAGVKRFAFNWALSREKENYVSGGKFIQDKDLRKEFELADIDDIAMQSSCSNYENKVLNDKVLPLQFVGGSHFAVKAAALYNYLLNTNKKYADKYEMIKSGTKIKYYYCKNKSNGDIFAYMRGSYPIEMAPEIDLDTQFEKCILSPINSIIEPLGE